MMMVMMPVMVVQRTHRIFRVALKATVSQPGSKMTDVGPAASPMEPPKVDEVIV
jgi:hypothetical protein